MHHRTSVRTVSGNVVTLAWQGAPAGGVATGYTVFASLSPGGTAIATLPTSTTGLTVTDVPNGVVLRARTRQQSRRTSGASNEVIVVVPGGGACATPPNPATNLTQSVVASVVTLTGGAHRRMFANRLYSASGWRRT